MTTFDDENAASNVRGRGAVGAITARVALLIGSVLAAAAISVFAGGCTQTQTQEPASPAGPGAPTPGPTSPPSAIPATPVPLGSGQIVA